jgi:hypothetical protein
MTLAPWRHALASLANSPFSSAGANGTANVAIASDATTGAENFISMNPFLGVPEIPFSRIKIKLKENQVKNQRNGKSYFDRCC